MTIRTLDPAEQELEEIQDYYDAERPGLGTEFVLEFRRSVDKILRWPTAWAKVPRAPKARRCQLDRFPYGVIYQIIGDEIVIVAVAHLKRRPTYWRGRLQ